MKQNRNAFSNDPAYVDILKASYQRILEHTDCMVFVKNTDLVYLAASMPFLNMVGKTSMDDIIGHTDFEVFEDQALARRYTEDDKKLLASGKDMPNYLEPLMDDHGMPRYSTTSKYILRDADGTPIGLLGISRDITREYISRRFHQQELKYLFELPADTYATLFLDIDDWRIIRHQRQTVGGHALPALDTMDEFLANAMNCIADPSDEETRNFYKTFTKESMQAFVDSGKRTKHLEYLRRLSDGEVRWVRGDLQFLVDPESGHLCAIWSLRDIDMEKHETMELIHAAERDQMTGLYNRAFTMKCIQQTLEELPSHAHALLMIDVDNFKNLNDTMGHQTGDQFLTDLADVLKKQFRENDIIGRIGGDEFFVLMKAVPNIEILKEKASSLLNAVQKLCSNYPAQDLSVSIGISVYPAMGTELMTLYTKADDALYRAKRQGKNQFIIA